MKDVRLPLRLKRPLVRYLTLWPELEPMGIEPTTPCGVCLKACTIVAHAG